MNQLVTKEKITSLEIAEIAGKSHFNVLQAIRNMEPAWEKITQFKFQLGSYVDMNGQKRPMYELNKDECLYIATKFNDEARVQLVIRWKELENKEKEIQVKLPNKRELAQMVIEQADELEKKDLKL